MKQTHYLTTTVQPGSRLDIALDDLTVGQTVEVIVIIQKPDQPPKADIDRRAFMKLPMAERRQLLATQAEAMREHYEQDSDWQDWLASPILKEELAAVGWVKRSGTQR